MIKYYITTLSSKLEYGTFMYRKIPGKRAIEMHWHTGKWVDSIWCDIKNNKLILDKEFESRSSDIGDITVRQISEKELFLKLL